MRRILTALFFFLMLIPAVARADPSAIRGVISDQIEAFQRDDFDHAFTHASPGIQGMFGTPERFGQMVRNGYPMVWRPGEVTFLELREVAGRLWQKVMIVDQSGTLHILDYQMIEAGAVWQINGVQVLRATGLGA